MVNLGDGLSVYTGNVGISVSFRCEYNTKITTSTQSFDVQTVSAFGENRAVGNLASAFGMTLSSPAENSGRFVMGGELEVLISWTAREGEPTDQQNSYFRDFSILRLKF